MGVKISPLVDDVKKVITFENLIGKRIAIDGFNALYQFLAIIRGQDGEPLKDLQGNVTSHLSGIFNRIINLLEENVRPIFIFDGPPNEFKVAEIQRRHAIREEATKKMAEVEDAQDSEEAVKFAQASSKLTGDMIDESKDLLQAMGIPIIQAAQDGEAQAAYLVSKDIAWAVGSQDYDSLLFGANRVVRNLSHNRTRRVKATTVRVDLEFISLPKVLEQSGLTQEQLIDVGILIGLDFFPGIQGIGAKTAVNLLKQYGTIDALVEQHVEVRKKVIEMDLDTVAQVRKIFTEPTVNTEIEDIKWNAPDQEKISEILVDKHNFNKERVDSAIHKLMNIGSTKTQKTIDAFFKFK